ncbi:MAG: hypothetical protein ABH884_01465, partial [Candidatus Komeilibacteria bacterium]
NLLIIPSYYTIYFGKEAEKIVILIGVKRLIEYRFYRQLQNDDSQPTPLTKLAFYTKFKLYHGGNLTNEQIPKQN